MGQKVNPVGNRLGIIKGWDSNWYGGKDFSGKLVEDSKIREYLNARLAKASISRIIIERTLKLITVTVNTARPGIIIGKGGQEVDKLKEELKKRDGELTAGILKDVLAITKKVGDERGYSLIMQASQQIVYIDNSIDITDEVMKRYDSGK